MDARLAPYAIHPWHTRGRRRPEAGVERPALEVADIFRLHGPAWREAQRGHLSLGQLKVMSAITQCRTAALGGHVFAPVGLATHYHTYAVTPAWNRSLVMTDVVGLPEPVRPPSPAIWGPRTRPAVGA